MLGITDTLLAYLTAGDLPRLEGSHKMPERLGDLRYGACSSKSAQLASWCVEKCELSVYYLQITCH